MSMRVSFDFLVSGFTVGCSISRDNFSLSSFDDTLLSTQSLAISVITVITSILVFRYWQSLKYAAVSYEIPVPKQCSEEWTGDILDNPSIRVSEARSRMMLPKLTNKRPLQITTSIATVPPMESFWERLHRHLQKILTTRLQNPL
jgi:hypothetical protein